MAELDDILNPQPEPEPAPAPIIDPTPEPEPEPTPTGDSEPTPSPGVNEELERLRKEAAGLKAEADRQRRRAQELEAQRIQAQPQPEKPDFWEQPEAVVNQAVSAVEERMTRRFLDMSEASARARHQDFDSKFEVFAELVGENPALYQAMLQDVDPGEFVYKTASQAIAVREMGDPTSYKEKLKAEIRAELEAEYAEQKKKEVEAAIAARLKPGFSEQRSVQPRDTSGKFTGHRPMTEILSTGKRV